MAVLNGHPSQAPVLLNTGFSAPGTTIPIGGPTTGNRTIQTAATVVDGTPVRVVVYALAAAVGIVALRAAGFKFNVGVAA